MEGQGEERGGEMKRRRKEKKKLADGHRSGRSVGIGLSVLWYR